ncbi:unnamed protein product [Zymoseptoria tritici ST99CH_1E4]|uniref:F-box domain-containing protein n=1 Tax=Zymoseptoria tritici ST99CH_1E4 TaxID=1276532 RepID=A0A2H1GXD4_ZYMTR|nr:unnamed protein product [Zymoseptoria tritici ST99CH_1E4]
MTSTSPQHQHHFATTRLFLGRNMSSPPTHAAKVNELFDPRKLPIDETSSYAYNLSETKEDPADDKLSADTQCANDDDDDTSVHSQTSADKTAAGKEDRARLPPLLRLPAELRNEIYSYIFPPPPAALFKPHAPDMYCASLCHRSMMIPPLLHTSQQIRAESSGVFFSTAVFVFDHSYGVVSYLKTLLRRHVEMIQHIHYNPARPRTFWDPHWASNGLLEGKELKQLRLELAHAGVAALRDGVIKVWVVLGKKVKRESGLWTEDGLWTARPGEY